MIKAQGIESVVRNSEVLFNEPLKKYSFTCKNRRRFSEYNQI